MRKKNILFIFFFIVVSSINAQQGWWTWMKGTYPGTPVVNWGTQGVAALTNEPPGEYQYTACWTDSKGIFWQFSGGNGWGYPTLWKYDPATNMWTWVKGPNIQGTTNLGVWGTKGVANIANTPPALTTAAATWVDANDNLWLFGGFGWGTPTGAFRGYMSALWKYDPLANMWTWMNGPSQSDQPGVYGTQGVPAAANYPPPRTETNAAWVDNNGKFWLFGGWGRNGDLNDMWKYDPLTNQWAWMKGANTAGSNGNYGTKGIAATTNNPPSRGVHSRWKDLNGNFWLFGGSHISNTNGLNDMWKFDPSTNNWTWMSGSNLMNQMPTLPTRCVPSTTSYPQARRENSSNWVDRCGNFWMFSGDWLAGGTAINDMWCYKVQTNEWVLITANVAPSGGTKGVPAASNMPPTTTGYAAFTKNNEFWLFAGRRTNIYNESNTLWRYIPDSTCAQSLCAPPNPNPTASFSGTNLIGCASLTVNFTNTSSNSTSWIWNFGDGSPTSSVQNPTHTYPTPGQYSVTLIANNATNSDTTSFINYVTVVPNAVASTNYQDTICIGQSVTFTNTSTGATSYLWSNSALGIKDTNTNLTYTFNTSGTYTITLYATNAYGCNDTLPLTITVLQAGLLTQNVSICAGNTYTLPGGAVVAAAGTYNDTIGNGLCDSIITTIVTLIPASTFSQNPLICVGCSFTLPSGNSVTTAGTYYDTLTATNGCDSVITTNLSVVTSFTSSQNPSICSGDSFTLPDGTFTTIAGTYIDTIPSVGGCDSIITTTISSIAPSTSSVNPILCIGNSYTLPSGNSVTTAGTYYDTLIAKNGCDSIITTTLVYNPNSTSAASPVICAGQSYTLPSGNSITTAGTYYDTIIAKNGCNSIVTTTLTVNTSPVVTISSDITITEGDNTTLNATGGGTYNWYPTNGLNDSTSASVIAKPLQTTTYCVEVTNSNGCKDTACVTVTVEIKCAIEANLGIPNAFSPNNDAVNDEFCLQGWDDCIQMFKITIFDRWGEKVYESSDPNFCWDGKRNGNSMDAQVFVYHVRAIFWDQQKLILRKGNISLIR